MSVRRGAGTDAVPRAPRPPSDDPATSCGTAELMSVDRGSMRRMARQKVSKRCGKVRYRDRIAALLALASAQHADGSKRPKVEARAYRCPDCRGWHLTSRKTWHP